MAQRFRFPTMIGRRIQGLTFIRRNAGIQPQGEGAANGFWGIANAANFSPSKHLQHKSGRSKLKLQFSPESPRSV